MSMAKMKILLVEDEEAIRSGLTDLLVYHGYQVECARDGEEALNKAREQNYELVILDIMLPKIDGFTVCETLRREKPSTPIIMLTAKDAEEDVIAGLSLGADDYVTKPFSLKELLLRIEAILRRGYPDVATREIILLGAEFEIDLSACEVKDLCSPENAVAKLTFREADILRYLYRQKHRAVSRDELLIEVWGYRKESGIETRTVDIHIAKLRQKIERDTQAPQYLVTIRSKGYQLQGFRESE